MAAISNTAFETISLAKLVSDYPKLSTITDADVLGDVISAEMNQSLAQIVSLLPEEEAELILEGTDMDSLLYDWKFWGRPSQMPPDNNLWKLFAMVCGRGVGKTRAGAEWVCEKALSEPGIHIFLVGRTAADCRDVMINGGSGIMKIGRPEDRPKYYPSRRELVWPNGSTATHYSAEEPDQLRGPSAHYAWCDEIAAWKFALDTAGTNAWDNVKLATRDETRNGGQPQIFITTTPKRTPFMFDLIALEKEKENVIITRGSTLENAGNLPMSYIEDMLDQYGDTRLGAQELYGLMLENVEGALWDDELIKRGRIMMKNNVFPILPLHIIAVDPSVAENPKDECGIIVAGATNQRRLLDRHAYVLEDYSIKGSPSEWVQEVNRAWKKYQCPVVVETNQGKALVTDALKAVNDQIQIIDVHAYKGKQLRAEPVTLKYDKERVHHINYLPELEAQMTSWVPGETNKSPDRVDAMVYAITALLINPPKHFGGGPLRAKSLANRQIPKFQNRQR